MQRSRELGVFLCVDLLVVAFSLALSQCYIDSPKAILIYATLVYAFMISSLRKKHRKWFTFDTVFIVVTYVFYFGQYIELAMSGKVENTSLNITKSYDISYVNIIALYVVAYIAVLHIAFLLYKPKIQHRGKKLYLDYSKGRFVAWAIYILSLPFGCYYEYSRAKYSSLHGYGATLYANLAGSSALLRISEFVSGFVISMFILLLILEEGRKSKWILLLSIIPYLIFYLSAGSRLQIGLLAITIAFIYMCWYRREKKIQIKTIVIAFVIV